jgi:hypothetical protein
MDGSCKKQQRDGHNNECDTEPQGDHTFLTATIGQSARVGAPSRRSAGADEPLPSV